MAMQLQSPQVASGSFHGLFCQHRLGRLSLQKNLLVPWCHFCPVAASLATPCCLKRREGGGPSHTSGGLYAPPTRSPSARTTIQTHTRHIQT